MYKSPNTANILTGGPVGGGFGENKRKGEMN